MNNPVKRINTLISRGEGEMLDFKKEISSVHRIAKSIVAFANHHGGTLLIGVNDNGTISGVRAEEEKFMLEESSKKCCNPPIDLVIHEWNIKGKIVLEVLVPNGNDKPYYAIDETGKGWVHIRHADQCLLASKVVVEVLKRRHGNTQTLIVYSDMEKALLEYLSVHSKITLKEYCKLMNISRWRAMKILVNLISVGVLNVFNTEEPEFYTLA